MIDRARHLSGRLVVATFLSVKPFDLWQDRQGRDFTIIGAADRDDERRARSGSRIQSLSAKFHPPPRT